MRWYYWVIRREIEEDYRTNQFVSGNS